MRRRRASANVVYRNDGQPEPVSGQPPQAPGAAGRRPTDNGRRPRRPLDRARRRGRSADALARGRRAAHRARRCSTSTTTATSTSCSPPTARRRSPSSTTASGRFHEVADRGPAAISEAVSGLLVDRLRRGRPRRPRRPVRRRAACCAWRNATERTDGRGDQDRPSSRGRSTRSSWRSAQAARPRPRRPARPARPSRRVEQAGRAASCRPGPQRREAASRRRRCRSALESPGLDGLAGRRPGRRPAARPPGRSAPGEAPALARNLGNGQHWLALRARRPLAGQARADADQLARDRHPRRRSKGRGSTSPTTTRRPSPGLAQSVAPVVLGLGNSPKRRPGPPPLARRRHAVRAERRRRPEARPGREQPQDGELPGTFHVERRAVRLPRRLPGRRRPRLPRRARRLRPARPRRVGRDRRPTSSGRATGSSGSRSPSRWTRSPISIT